MGDSDASGRLTRVFLRAAELDGAARSAYLDEACGSDAALRNEVETLLQHDQSTLELVDPKPVAPPTPTAFGPYRVLRLLGEGGMGLVYLAEQTAPIRREVAIKLVRPGFDSRSVLDRFDLERQALALMNHPNISRVYDAGSTPDGRPYFVMEHVAGVPITAHCDRERLDVRKRLELLIQVCEAVQHAHQKAVIHRDLKPSNVLVAVQDGRAVPKIIDFGVAKATDLRLTERTVLTEQGLVVGTPEHMSPEQADPGNEDIDTRTDVYALGVMLYELLVGTPPFDPRELRQVSLGEMLRRIREDDPPRPSTRLESLGAAAAELARRRGTDEATLGRELTGDLDWITMKALEKDRTRRYATALDLAADLEGFLGDKPVAARPPSRAYRVGKFLRRHRAGATMTALLTLAVVLGSAATAWQAVRATRALREAEKQSLVASKTNEFLADILGSASPSRARGDEMTVAELLAEASRKVEQSPPELPIEAQVRKTLSEVYFARGDYEHGLPHAEQAWALLRADKGEHHPETLDAQSTLGVLFFVTGRPDEGLDLGRQAAESLFEIRGAADRASWSVMNNYSMMLQEVGRTDEAREWVGRVLHEQREMLAPDDVELGYTLHGLVGLATSPEQAARHQQEAVSIFRAALGVEHESTLAAMSHLGKLLVTAGSYSEAAEVLEEVLAVGERIFPQDHVLMGDALHSLLWTYSWEERPEQALRDAQRCVEIYRRLAPPCDRRTVDALMRLASLYDGILKQHEVAAAVLREAEGEFASCPGVDLAAIAVLRGRAAEAASQAAQQQ